MQIAIIPEPRQEISFEIIERKGRGHPDTLADGLAEALSRSYARYTRERFGVVLHHNFDKVGLLGGKSQVAFGEGRILSPVRVLLNGRASPRLGAEEIPVHELLTQASCKFLVERLPKIDPQRDLVFHDNLSTGSSPGHVETGNETVASRKRWFVPESMEDLRERKKLTSNDTSVGCAHWPFSPTEEAVLVIERRLTSPEFQRERPWLGTDIKVMACRVGGRLDLTLCIPQVADHVPGADVYREHLEELRVQVRGWAEELVSDARVQLWLNTKDDFELPELYLTAIGSSIESGDEGLVGRGNRVNGLIAMCRPYSMEGACGKNPVYHVGKLYNLIALEAAKRLYERFGVPVDVWLVGQEGRHLDDPWQAVVRAAGGSLPEPEVAGMLTESLAMLPQVTEALLAGSIELY